MGLLTQIEGAAATHPFLAKVLLIVLVILAFKFWPIIGPILKAIWSGISSLKVPAALDPAKPASATTATPAARVSAIQTLVADAMAAGDNQALDNIVAVAKGYAKKATQEASPQ